MDFTGKVVEVYDEKTDYLNTMGSEGEVNFEKATTFIFQTTKPGAWRGKVMATVYGVDVKVGDRLSFVGIVRPQSQTHNWNLQNQDDYLRNRGVAAAVRVIGSSIQMEAMQKNHLLKSAALDARTRIDAVLSALPEYQQNFIKGIAFGDKSGLSGQQMQVLSQTGIMDAFAVSGMHMGVVVLFAAALGNFLNRLFPFRRSFRMILIVVFALFYGMMTGFPPSVLRATVMSLAAAFALLYGEKNRSKLMILYAAFVCVLL